MGGIIECLKHEYNLDKITRRDEEEDEENYPNCDINVEKESFIDEDLLKSITSKTNVYYDDDSKILINSSKDLEETHYKKNLILEPKRAKGYTFNLGKKYYKNKLIPSF